MPDSSQEDGTAHVGAYVPTNHAEALFQISQQRSERGNKTTQSDLLRKYLKEGLIRELRSSDDIPPEVYDLLDADLQADAGGGDFSEKQDVDFQNKNGEKRTDGGVADA